MDQDTLNSFLKRISSLESSNGKNTNHKTINKPGIQQGQTAIGQFGLLPNTVDDILTRKARSGTLSPDLAMLMGQDQDTLHEILAKRPDLEHEIAQSLAEHVLSNQNGNDLAAAYAWNNGTNLKPNQITSEKLLSSPYAQRYAKVKSNEAINDLNNGSSSQNQASEPFTTPKVFDINNIGNKILPVLSNLQDDATDKFINSSPELADNEETDENDDENDQNNSKTPQLTALFSKYG